MIYKYDTKGYWLTRAMDALVGANEQINIMSDDIVHSICLGADEFDEVEDFPDIFNHLATVRAAIMQIALCLSRIERNVPREEEEVTNVEE